MAIALIAATFAFVVGILLMKRVRQSVQEESSLGEGDPGAGAFPLHTYHAVIQQLKQQKHELESLQQAERRRAKTTENVSAAVLSNLTSGVLFFNTSGLVRQANAAAKQILGFASPLGMNASDLFRDATVCNSATNGNHAMPLAQAVGMTLHDATAVRRLETDYTTPSGETRFLEITVSPVYAANAELLGGACLINDQTEMAKMRHELRGGASGEMALELRNSLATISGFAKSMAASPDTNRVAQLARDIAAEAEHVEKTIGAFLAGATGKSASAGRSS
jgi:PAS domain-containing protein